MIVSIPYGLTLLSNQDVVLVAIGQFQSPMD